MSKTPSIKRIVVVGFKRDAERSVFYRMIDLPETFWPKGEPFCYGDLVEWWRKILRRCIEKDCDFASIRFVKQVE